LLLLLHVLQNVQGLQGHPLWSIQLLVLLRYLPLPLLLLQLLLQLVYFLLL
jgi:hypothetical protein